MPPPRLRPESYDAIARRFRVLGVPIRLQILHRLGEGEATVGQLTASTQSSQPNVSKHLSTLLQAGLVVREQRGKAAYYRIADPTIFELCELVCGSLEQHLKRQQAALA